MVYKGENVKGGVKPSRYKHILKKIWEKNMLLSIILSKQLQSHLKMSILTFLLKQIIPEWIIFKIQRIVMAIPTSLP